MVDYLEEIKKMIISQFNLEEELVDDDSYLEADLNITDLDMEDLIDQVEDQYHLQIPQESYSKFEKVSDIADYLYEHADNI